jgi:hypothetical protein
MIARTRHAVVVMPGLTLLALIMACGGTVDIEATVEAKAQSLAKAIVEATAQAAPTATPVPPYTDLNAHAYSNLHANTHPDAIHRYPHTSSNGHGH